MRVGLITVLLILAHGLVYAESWTVLEPGGEDGQGNLVYENSSVADAELAAAESAIAAKEAADAEIPLNPMPAGQENWSILKAEKLDGQSHVINERATTEEAEAGASRSVGTDFRIVPHYGGRSVFYTPEQVSISQQRDIDKGMRTGQAEVDEVPENE